MSDSQTHIEDNVAEQKKRKRSSTSSASEDVNVKANVSDISEKYSPCQKTKKKRKVKPVKTNSIDSTSVSESPEMEATTMADISARLDTIMKKLEHIVKKRKL